MANGTIVDVTSTIYHLDRAEEYVLGQERLRGWWYIHLLHSCIPLTGNCHRAGGGAGSFREVWDSDEEEETSGSHPNSKAIGSSTL
ncbi:cytochrome P450, family 706, subfamily A, polypeptide 4 [Prunus dulcis]|uniref:Cytochrome P450, family 706, subfamily A, polypeptide 4 n=1 Tax=Prunus dulcis TaxID=3755 RepID=A0A5H2Y0H5_PRUDU|nr:cytochrome P450, family 706, subfamily A, polypeptide 4 [Prunus dulcis]